MSAREPLVMIVDDEAGVLRAAERVLAGRWNVEGHSSPLAAIESSARTSPDLLITDIRMPEMDGFSLASALRRQCPDADVIFMTGSHTEPDEHLLRAVQEQAFYFIQKPFDRRVLLTLVDRCLELRRLRHADREHALRMQRELDEAMVFQRTMLPASPFRLGGSGTGGGVRVAAWCRPCSELGGDLYDYAVLPDGRLAFIIADVRGHGASAALLTAVVKAAFNGAGGAERDPGRIMESLAAMIAPFGDDRFVTAICGRLEGAGCVLEYVNAGHPPALVWEDGGRATPLEVTSPIACSSFPAGSWRVARRDFRRAWAMLAFTDGLLERDAVRGNPLAAIARLEGVDAMDADGLAAAADGACSRWLAGGSAADDMSVLALSWRPN